MEYYSAFQRKYILTHATTWMKLENIVPVTKRQTLGFPGGAVVESPPANAGDTGSSPGPGRSHMPRSN